MSLVTGLAIEELTPAEAETTFASKSETLGDRLERWTPLHHPALLSLWDRLLGRGGACRIVVAWDASGGLAAFAPFMRIRTRAGPVTVPTLRFIGNNIGYPGDILYSEVFAAPARYGAVAAILDHVASSWSIRKWELGYLPSTSATWNAAAEILGDGVQAAASRAPVPFASVRLPDEWDAYFSSLTSNTRSSYRRGLRNLEARGQLRIDVDRTPEGARRRVEELIRNHGRWLAGTEKEGWFGDGSVSRFLISSAEWLAREGHFVSSTLELDGEPIAWIVGPEYRGACFLHLTSYDRRYSDASPSLVLGIELMHELISKGRRRVDLGPGSSLFKKRLGGVESPYVEAVGYQGWARRAVRARGRISRRMGG